MHCIMTYTAQSVAEFFICPTSAEAVVDIETEESRSTQHDGEDAATRHGLCVGEHWHAGPLPFSSSFLPSRRPPNTGQGSGYGG